MTIKTHIAELNVNQHIANSRFDREVAACMVTPSACCCYRSKPSAPVMVSLSAGQRFMSVGLFYQSEACEVAVISRTIPL